MIDIIPNWHPIMVHFAVTLLMGIGVLQLLLWSLPTLVGRVFTPTIQTWLVILGVLAVIATVSTGAYAYFTVAHDAPSHRAMTDHRNWALLTASLFLVGALAFFKRPQQRWWLAGLFFVAAFLSVSVTAYKGGELVYRYGVGVMSLPETNSAGHHHDAQTGGGHPHENTTPEAGEARQDHAGEAPSTGQQHAHP